jgi:hypothetical protein
MDRETESPSFTMPAVKQTDFTDLRRSLEEASHAPRWLDSEPAVYRREVERLFMQHWRFVGREEELERPGDYFTLRAAGEPSSSPGTGPAGYRASTTCASIAGITDP